MDIFSYSRQQSSNYKSPRIQTQGHDQNHRGDDIDLKRFYQIAAGTSPTANKLFQNIIREVGGSYREQTNITTGSTSKVLKNLVNRAHLQDSNRKGEKQARSNRSRDLDMNPLFVDNTNGRDYEVDSGLEQGQKLPVISHKKMGSKADSMKKLERVSGLDKYMSIQGSVKGETESYAPHSVNNRTATHNTSSSPPKQNHKETWRSPPKYTNEENTNFVSPSVGLRTRYSSGGIKFVQNTMSGGEDEENNNSESIGFSLMISPMKGSHRMANHFKKKTGSIGQTRVGSPDQKEMSVDYADARKGKAKAEVQNNGKGKIVYKTVRGSSTVFPSSEIAKYGIYEEKKNLEGWDQNDSEGIDSGEDEEDYEERKNGYDRNGDNEKKREEKTSRLPGYMLALKKNVSQPQPLARFEPVVTTIMSKQNKRLQDHLQISRIGDREKESVQMKREHAYKEFMLRLNFSFNVQVKVPTEKTFVAYKYFLGKGNNSMLIKSLMKQRWWWVQVDNKDDVNFMWTQLKQNKFIEGLKQKRKSPFENLEWSGLSSSHCNNGNDTTATTTSFIDSMTDCESDTTEGENRSVVKKSRTNSKTNGKIPLRKDTGEITGTDPVTSAYKKLFTNQEIMLMNSATGGKGHLYPEDCEEIGRLRKGPASQVVGDPSVMKMCNHLESNYHLANKKALLWNMKSYYEAVKQNVFDYLPLTFHVRNGFEDKEYQKFVEYYNNREKEIQEQEKLAAESKEGKKGAAKKLRNIWIVKPGENTNRGVGISVCDTLAQINEIVGTTQGNSDGKKRTYLIQQYLDKPLLYNKRKFDIRCYILMTCINGMMKGYWYQDGYIRTASKEFSLKNVTNKLIHLTNDAVQKKAEDYGKFESGNKLSYNEFQRYLDAHHDGNINFNTDIYPQIKQLATDAIKGVYGKIDPYRRENSFEIFGLDFMIDTNLRAWLIEVNTNPDINASSPVLTRVIPPMVDNALKLTIDQMYPPPTWQTSKKQMLPENLLENNKFELVFDEVEDGPALRNILQADKGATGDLILEIVAEEEEEDAEEECKD